jgi:ribokinase
MSGRVVVVGALHLDRRFAVAVLPGPGETVRSAGAAVGPGGKGLNQAVAAAAAGASTVMVGAVGVDPEADAVLSSLSEHGVDVSGVAHLDGASTGGAVVLIDQDGENSIVIESGANGVQQPDAVVTRTGRLVADDVLVLQNELPASVSRAAAAAARAVGSRVLWNAAPAPAGFDEVIELADVVLCNEVECRRMGALLGLVRDDPAETAAAMATRLDATVVCTLGGAGAVIADSGSFVRIAAPRVRAVDTTGAGDTFAGYLAAGLQAGLHLEAAAEVAVVAGALAVSRSGAAEATPTSAEVQAFIAGQSHDRDEETE